MTEFCNVSKLPVLSVAMLGGESLILCLILTIPVQVFSRYLHPQCHPVPPSVIGQGGAESYLGRD